jgi:uncharacterized protein with PIN domain
LHLGSSGFRGSAVEAMLCTDCGRYWYSSGARRMLRDDDRCPACNGRLELAELEGADERPDAGGEWAEGGTRNG